MMSSGDELAGARDWRVAAPARQVYLERLEPFFPVALALAGLAVLLYAAASATIVQDSWSTLVAGREVARHGLPSVDRLTVYGSGHRWVDQQWLAQLLLYAVEHAGLDAVGLAGAASALLAFGVALWTAARRGVSVTVVTLVAFLAVAAAPWAFQVRAQELAMPLFTATLALLVADADARRRRTLLALPLLCLWANVHGSVILGAALVALYGLTVVARQGRQALGRAAPYVLGAPVAVFASPYAFGLAGYYHLLLVEPPFRHLVQEWQRPPVAGYTAPLFVLAAVTAAVVVARRRDFSFFELVVLAATLALALDALHNIVWFALAALAIVPPRIVRVRPRRERPVGGAFTVVAAAGFVVAAGVAVAAPPSHYDELGRNAVRAVAAAVDSTPGKIYADDAHADWVLWHVPSARGRVLYDSRIELVDRADIERISYLQVLGRGYERTLRGVNVLVLGPNLAVSFRRAGWGRVAYSDRETTVLVRPATRSPTT